MAYFNFYFFLKPLLSVESWRKKDSEQQLRVCPALLLKIAYFQSEHEIMIGSVRITTSFYLCTEKHEASLA
jgi:hypothetical protein